MIFNPRHPVAVATQEGFSSSHLDDHRDHQARYPRVRQKYMEGGYKATTTFSESSGTLKITVGGLSVAVDLQGASELVSLT